MKTIRNKGIFGFIHFIDYVFGFYINLAYA
jgi:hypothetical protein